MRLLPAARYGCHSHSLGTVQWVWLGHCKARVPQWFLFLFWDVTKQLILEITFATSLLLRMGELAGGGSVAVAVAVRWQATCDSLLSAMSVCLSVCFFLKIFSNLFQTFHCHRWCFFLYWVNLSKRGRKDGVFQALAGLLQEISWGRSTREIPRSSLASQGKPCPSQLFYSDLHSISNTFPYWPS